MTARETVGLSILGLIACALFYRHRVRRASAMGAFRCERCGSVFADLDEAGEKGNGHVSPVRPVFARRNGGEVERSGEWPS